MKNNILIAISFILFSGFHLFAGDGSENNPFTVNEAIKKKDTTTRYWVKGYVVGEIRDYSNNKYFYELAPPFEGTSAYLIADKIDEIDLSLCMPVQLINKDDFYLDENPEKWRKEILIYGFLKDYFAMPGIKDVITQDILTSEPWNDETTYWNFYEEMNSKNYIPASNTNTFAGGTYIGDGFYTNDIKIWKFSGATLGDTGKDQKWGRAAARIRLTEGPTGNPGYIQMEEDKLNGIGVVRFWAGNYEEDSSGGALALYISQNQGQSWEKMSNSQPITKKWLEYQFIIDMPGNIRLRISKDENGSKGINVDNIRISDYRNNGTSINETKKGSSTFYCISQGIHINTEDALTQIKIFELTGQCIKQLSVSPGSHDISLNQGMYLLQINNQVNKIIVR